MKLYTALTIPSTKWINDPKRNPKRWVAASLFAGGGFSSLGLKLAGFDIRYACEFTRPAAETYAANAQPSTVVDERDVRKVTPADVLRACRVRKGELDYLDLSPPCRLFSNAARGSYDSKTDVAVKYDNKLQKLGDLFEHGARLLRGLQPRVFAAENVAAMTAGKYANYLLEAHDAFVACGYRVRAAILNAADLGVPQDRRRLIFVGVRKDLGVEPEFPRPLPDRMRLGLADVVSGAIGTVNGLGLERPNSLKIRDARFPIPTVTSNSYRSQPQASITYTGYIRDRRGEMRLLTIDELKTCFGVPRDYVLAGSVSQQWKQLGDSHVPLSSYAVASKLAEVALR